MKMKGKRGKLKVESSKRKGSSACAILHFAICILAHWGDASGIPSQNAKHKSQIRPSACGPHLPSAVYHLRSTCRRQSFASLRTRHCPFFGKAKRFGEN